MKAKFLRFFAVPLAVLVTALCVLLFPFALVKDGIRLFAQDWRESFPCGFLTEVVSTFHQFRVHFASK
jgi:hypothetical protein